VECNTCHKTTWMCKWIRNKNTGRCALLDERYVPQTGQIAKKHECMSKGQGFYVNKYLKQAWCEFCSHYYDLSHWCIFKNRPQLMCIKEVQMCNHSAYFEPLTDGWFNSHERK
jgi:hypothetical protein